MPALEFIVPKWPASPRVHAASTTRGGGISIGRYASLNLGEHVGDVATAVAENRRRVRDALHLPAEPYWLQQVHGTRTVAAHIDTAPIEADAAWTDRPNVVCAVLPADCLPVLLCDRAGTRVAVAHAGWRGLAAGVIEAACAAGGFNGKDTLAWLGPAIGPEHFAVGAEVREEFVAWNAGAAAAFHSNAQGRWHADLYQLARQRLAALGIAAVYGGDGCTASDVVRLYSYRRNGITGRMATLIWLSA